jgi:hypothetical protein
VAIISVLALPERIPFLKFFTLSFLKLFPRSFIPIPEFSSLGHGYWFFFKLEMVKGKWDSVVDPHHLDANPNSTCNPDADPDSDFYLMRIRMRNQIRLFTLMQI